MHNKVLAATKVISPPPPPNIGSLYLLAFKKLIEKIWDVIIIILTNEKRNKRLSLKVNIFYNLLLNLKLGKPMLLSSLKTILE